MAVCIRCFHSFQMLTTHLKNAFLTQQRFSHLLGKRNKNLHLSYVDVSSFYTHSKLDKRRKTSEERKSARIIEYSPKPKGEIIEVWRNITVKELADILDKNTSYVQELFLNQVQGANTAISDIKLLQEGIKRSGHRMRIIGKPVDDEDVPEKDTFRRPAPDKSLLRPCPPVVTVMGHVDHGKTTLLDALRHSNVVKQEFGGITQHIGAFSVTLDSGAKITFLDTPGHAAFTSMRERGANITNIVVLVVAADDGVMEQTIESIRMARQANVPILVAINKIDAPNADIERTKNMLVEHGIQVESMGGDVQAIPISALKRTNLEQLTEALILQADLLEIGADPTGPVEGVVVDSKVHPHRGKISTIIVQRGTLKKGAVLIADTAMAKVRGLSDADGIYVENVSPGYPVEIEGWKTLPSAGEIVLEVESERQARAVLRFRESKKLTLKQKEDAVVISAKEEQHLREYKEKLQLKRTLGRFKLRRDGPRKPETEKSDGVPTLNLIIKGDVDGTVEAILNTLDTYESSDCNVNLIHYGVGAITETDIEFAKTFGAFIYAFNVACPDRYAKQVDEDNIVIKHHNVIYKLVDDVKEEINAKLPRKEVEEIIGEATVLQEFTITEGRRKIPVAGCRCVKGQLKRSSSYRLIRNNEILYEGTLSSMRHLKSEVDVIKKDIECGLQLSNKDVSFKAGDTLICFEKKLVPQKTDWDPGF